MAEDTATRAERLRQEIRGKLNIHILQQQTYETVGDLRKVIKMQLDRLVKSRKWQWPSVKLWKEGQVNTRLPQLVALALYNNRTVAVTVPPNERIESQPTEQHAASSAKLFTAPAPLAPETSTPPLNVSSAQDGQQISSTKTTATPATASDTSAVAPTAKAQDGQYPPSTKIAATPATASITDTSTVAPTAKAQDEPTSSTGSDLLRSTYEIKDIIGQYEPDDPDLVYYEAVHVDLQVKLDATPPPSNQSPPMSPSTRRKLLSMVPRQVNLIKSRSSAIIPESSTIPMKRADPFLSLDEGPSSKRTRRQRQCVKKVRIIELDDEDTAKINSDSDAFIEDRDNEDDGDQIVVSATIYDL